MRTHAQRTVLIGLFLLGGAALSATAQNPSPAGLWDATVVVNNLEIPFKFEITQRGEVVAGAFFDGDVKIPSTAGSFANGALSLTFAQYGSRLDAAFNGDRLEGKYDRGTRGAGYAFTAARAVPAAAPSGPVPAIGGEWRIPLETDSSKGEQ